MARDLGRRLALASRDELRVIDRILTRLELGRERYGDLDLAKPREWRRELGEELLDAIVYETAETIATEDAARARLQDEAAAELAELRAWEERDRKTVVSSESTRLALEDLADREPYAAMEWDTSEFGGEGG